MSEYDIKIGEAQANDPDQSNWGPEPTDNKARLIEVKPCPFCGSSKYLVAYVGQPATSWYMGCGNCGARGPIVGTASPTGGTPAEPMETSWNRRIEAAGLLAGSVGVPSVSDIAGAYNVGVNTYKAPGGVPGWMASDLAHGAGIDAIHAYILTHTPEPKGRWILVRDQSPVKGDHVLVVRPDTPTTVRKIHFVQWADGDENDFEWWQPSPDFPKPPVEAGKEAP